MFKLNEYEVVFSYAEATGKALNEYQKLNVPKEYNDSYLRIVHCGIVKTIDNTGTIIGHGTSVCSPLDMFEKAKGRRIAFAKALKDSGFNQELRKEFWKRYFALVSFKEFKLVSNQYSKGKDDVPDTANQ